MNWLKRFNAYHSDWHKFNCNLILWLFYHSARASSDYWSCFAEEEHTDFVRKKTLPIHFNHLFGEGQQLQCYNGGEKENLFMSQESNHRHQRDGVIVLITCLLFMWINCQSPVCAVQIIKVKVGVEISNSTESNALYKVQSLNNL